MGVWDFAQMVLACSSYLYDLSMYYLAIKGFLYNNNNSKIKVVFVCRGLPRAGALLPSECAHPNPLTRRSFGIQDV